MKKYIAALILLISFAIIAAAVDGPANSRFPVPKKPWLGVKIVNLSDKMLKNLALDNGVKIKRVIEDSPAAEAGLERDDILLKYDGKEIEDADDLIEMVWDSDVGDEIEIEYLRDGEKKILSVELDRKRYSREKRIFRAPSPEHIYIYHDSRAWLGVRTKNLTDQLRTYFGTPENTGVLVSEVIEDSPAEEAGIKAGDIILKLGGKRIKNTKSLLKTVDYYDPENRVEVTVIREGEEEVFSVELGEQERRRPWHFYGIGPHDFSLDVPDIDIDVPEIHVPEFHFDPGDIEIEIDVDDLNERIHEKIEIDMTRLEDEMIRLRHKLKELKYTEI